MKKLSKNSFKMPLKRSASFSLLVEVLVRVFLIACFCYLETMAPFERVIPRYILEGECSYPRRESYVTGDVLWVLVLSVPCALSFIAWAILSDCNDALEILLAWSLSFGITGIITDMTKLIVGRPRPDFFYRCFPDGVQTEDLKCTGDEEEIKAGRVSFPSGHSSLSFCSLGVGSLWLCGRLAVLTSRRGSAGRVTACLAPLLLAAAVGMSRTCDYHHHWEDVLAGSALGFVTAIFSYKQYYNPLSSEYSGVPLIVTNSTKHVNAKPESPVDSNSKDRGLETTPLLKSRKEDKWI